MNKGGAARHVPVIVTVIVALALTMLPLPRAIDAFRPDWLALILIFWALALPGSYGVGIAWIVGIVLDVAQGTLLAQHALSLSLIVYLTVKFHLQLRVFPMSQMAATVFALLAIYRFVLFWINGIAGVDAPPSTYWGPVITGAMFWPLIASLLRSMPYRARARA